mgnify:CR=1 FL=1
MDDSETIITACVVAAAWLAWGLFSETRHNHGFIVAFLMPLALVMLPLLWIVYLLIKYTTLAAFILSGRREEHAEFLRKLKVRYGVFLLM